VNVRPREQLLGACVDWYFCKAPGTESRCRIGIGRSNQPGTAQPFRDSQVRPVRYRPAADYAEADHAGKESGGSSEYFMLYSGEDGQDIE
jgi:hypothetical protein